MVGYNSARPASGRVAARNNLKLATALGGSLAVALLAFPYTAAAQDECGVAPVGAGTVTCSPDNNPYATGVTYIALDDLTIVLEDGVEIDTSGNLNAGILAISGGLDSDLTIAGGTNTSITTDSDGGFGAFAATNSGDLTVNLDEITTTGLNAVGIVASSADGAVSISANDISTTGADAHGVGVLTNLGDITIDTGTISTAGIGAAGITAVSDIGDIDITADTITTSGATASLANPGAIGITATTGGTGTVTVDAGDITTTGTGATGIFATTADGLASVTADSISTSGDNANGITVSSTTGPVNLTVGDVSTTGDFSNAISATGGIDANVAANINGVVTTTGAADAVVITSSDMATVTVGSAGSVSASNGDSFVLTSVTGTTLNNAGTIAAAPNGFAVLANGGPITINSSGTLSSDIQLTAGNDRVNNSGTFVVGSNPDFGAGTDVFANSGTVQVGAGANAVVNSTFTGLETFNNNGGLIDLRNGRAGDTLTLPGTFNGSGNSQLGLDVVLDGSANDRLIIGGAASGQTEVLVGALPGQAVFNPGAVLIQAGAASNANAFDFAGGFIENGLVRNEIVYNPADFSFRLTGAPSDAAFGTLGFADGARNLWLRSADAVSAQLRAQRDALWSNDGGEASPRMWVQLHASKESRETSRNVNTFGQTRTLNSGLVQDFGGVQLGLDIGGGAGERGGFAFGVTGGYMASELNLRGADEVSFDTANAGVYGSFSSGNLFANVIGKYDHYWADVDMASIGFGQSINGSSYGARGEVGFRFGSDSFFVEPAASISWVNTSFDDFTAFGTQVSFEEDDGLRGRAGARIGGMLPMLGSTTSFYVGANYVHEFQGEDGVVFTSGGQDLRFTNARLQDYGEALAGINVGQANGISGFAEGTYTRSFKDNAAGELPLEGYGGRVGMRVRF